MIFGQQEYRAYIAGITRSSMKNILTIDVESWIHFRREFRRRGRDQALKEEKASDDGYIPYSTGKILDYLQRSGNRAHALLELLARNEFTSFRDHPSAMLQNQ